MREREAMAYLEGISGRGIVPGLDGIRELCGRLGNPQDALKFVHVAGTNAKGSVCAYIATVLQCGGYRVGRYISPVIFKYRERIQINDRCISGQALGRLAEQARLACDGMVADGLPQPTAFEVETAIGFLYFRERKCDIVVLETGMGGLLDATNVIESTVLSVITSVSMDHMAFLGKTLGEIAAQKAGILKPGVPAVMIRQPPEAEQAIAAKAASLGCQLTAVDPGRISSVRYGLEKQRFSYGGFSGLEISLAGRHQVENAALAVEALKTLGERGFPVAQEKLRQGLLQTAWAGRFTIVGKKPYFIVDGAHNEDGAKRLAESVEFYFTNKRIIYIMGVLGDKEYGKMIALTHALADQIITVAPPDNPRALPAYELAREAAKVHPKVTAAGSLEEAVEMARLLAGREGVIIAFGTLSFAGRLIEIAGRQRDSRGQ